MKHTHTQTATITIVVNDSTQPGLRAEHGFAAWIEISGRRLLFDTGQGSALCHNAEALGLDLSTADLLVLSHGHYDHAGAVPAMVECAPDLQLYLHPAATGARYSISRGVAREIGMPDEASVAINGLSPESLRWTTAPLELSAELGLSGPIPRLTDFEDTGGPFFVDTAGSRADPIMDDLALWVRTRRGLVVVVGCSHAGLINTLRQAQRVSGESKLHAAIGGFHLLAAGASRIERTVDALKELEIDLIVPCHCTGDEATAQLKRHLGQRVVIGAAGASFSFDLGC